MTYGMRLIGRGQTGAEILCAVMNLPKPSHKFQCYNKVISKAVEEVAEESLKIAALEAVTENNGSSDICEAFDGAWQKPVSYTHLDVYKRQP